MDTATIEHLATVRTHPAVSILCPLDQKRPGNAVDVRRLASLRDQAVDKLTNRSGLDDARAMLERVHAAVERVDLQHPPAAVAVFVSPTEAEVIALPVAVPERVVVGDYFASRDLLAAVHRTERVRVLVLSEHVARCFETTDASMVETVADGFPLTFERYVSANTPHADLPVGVEREHAEMVKSHFRAADVALASVQRVDRRPTVLAGTKRDIAFYFEITAHADDVIGDVDGNFERVGVAALHSAVAPVVERHVEARRAAACARVAEAAPRLAAGIDAVWAAAREGRGRELVVEETFRYPARVVEDRLEPASEDANDAVDGIVAMVLSTGGSVVTVAEDALADVGRVALLLRY